MYISDWKRELSLGEGQERGGGGYPRSYVNKVFGKTQEFTDWSTHEAVFVRYLPGDKADKGVGREHVAFVQEEVADLMVADFDVIIW